MKIGYTRDANDQEDLGTLLESVASAGYDGYKLQPGQYEQWLDDPDGFVRTYGERSRIVSALLLNGPLDAERIDLLRSAMQFIRAVGGKRVVYCYEAEPQSLTPIDLRVFGHQLSTLGHEACDHGLALSIHNHYGFPTMYRKNLRVLFEAIDDESVWWTLDTGHLYKAGEMNIASHIREFRYMIDNVLLLDYGRGQFRSLGQGEVPFEPVFGALREVNYNGWITVHDEGSLPLDEALAHGLEFVSGGLQRPQAAEAQQAEARRR
ncbi:MAG: sugar phosphate isomerase/epimerase [Chloroflexi bacterium]|nr:sugar phosphate isomerase/epimerase [Chloroflexota bacterium]